MTEPKGNWQENPHEAEEEQHEAEVQQHEEEEEQKLEEQEEQQEQEDEARSVNSSMVAEWGYDREGEEIEVTFNNGKSESYPCTPQQWQDANAAVSPGKWMHENVL